MRIIVTRLPGDKLSPAPIINPLATQQDVGVVLGSAYIYDSSAYNDYVIKMMYKGPLYPSDEVSVYDQTLGESFVAIVIGHSIDLTKEDGGAVRIQSTLTVRRLLIDG